MKKILTLFLIFSIAENQAQYIISENFTEAEITENSVLTVEEKPEVISVFPEMIAIDGGIIEIGSLYGDIDEVPVHKVKIDDFEIGRYPVTVGQYRYFCESTNRSMPAAPYWGWQENHPMVIVSWNDAVAYTYWLTDLTGDKYRLPTEAEWEYAARGGIRSLGFQFSGGNLPEEIGWIENNSEYRTHRVNRKTPNELGICDMSGNVLEWTADWYSPTYYSKSPFENPKGPEKGAERVLRGGSWYGNTLPCKVSFRSYFPPDYSFNFIGFRIVKERD